MAIVFELKFNIINFNIIKVFKIFAFFRKKSLKKVTSFECIPFD